MSTVDTVEQPKKKAGRPPKKKIQDRPSVQGEYLEREAKKSRQRKKDNQVIEKWYQITQGHKLCLCKKVATGSVYTTFVGSTKKKIDKNGLPTENFLKIKAMVKKLQKEGKLRVKV